MSTQELLERVRNDYLVKESLLAPVFSVLCDVILKQDEAIKSSIDRADDYADSYNSQPIRQVQSQVAAMLAKIAGT